MKITKSELKQKLKLLDEKILGLWVCDETRQSDDEIWEMFVVLLESRVELLNVCLKAGVPLTKEDALPKWLEKMSHSQKEIRLRELKKLHQKSNNVSKYRKYEDIFNLLEGKK